MKNIREAIHECIEHRVLPWIERDGISNLILPEQITPADCIRSKRCNRPHNPPHREDDLIIGLAGRAPRCIDKKAFVFTPGRIMLLPRGTPCAAIEKNWWRVKDLDPNQPPSILWLMVFPFGVQVQVLRTDVESDATEASLPYVLLGRHFNRLTAGLLKEVRSTSPHSSDIGRCFLAEFMYRCLRADTADIAGIPPRRPRGASSRGLARGGSRPSKRTKARRRSTSPVPSKVEGPTTGKSVKKGTKWSSSQMQAVREFIHSNYHVSITMDDIAESAHLSVNYFGHLFKEEVGVTPIQYLLNIRMEAARELLLTDLNISEVARMVGINDPYYFSRVFSRANGASPLQYRKKMIKAADRPPRSRRKSVE